MAKALYFLLTFLESGLAVFGIRSAFEEPPYKVLAHIGDGVEVRAYGPRVAAETDAGRDDGAAFSRLFRYISGANKDDTTIVMTAPVEMRGAVPPVRTGSAPEAPGTMRFFLPKARAAEPPPPSDGRVRIVKLSAATTAVLRFSGRLDSARVARHETMLLAAVAAAGRKTTGPPYVMGYDPPFTIPILRRNEVAVDLAP